MTEPVTESVDVQDEHAEPNRRGFFAKLLVAGGATAAFPALASMSLAQGERDREKGKGKGGRRPNPSDIAKRLIEQFDKDGDGALNVAELTKALEALRSRGRGPGGPGGPGKGKGKGKGGPGKGKGGPDGKGKGKGKKKGGEGGGEGVRPKRPEF